MSRTGGQAGRTWRLIAIAVVVGFGTWVAGNHGRSDLPSFAASGTIAEPSVRAQQPPTASPAKTPSPATPSAEPVPRRRPAPRTTPSTAVPLTGPGGHSEPEPASAQHQTRQRRAKVKVLYLTFDDGPSREWT